MLARAFDAAYDLSLYTEAAADVDDALGDRRVAVQFHAMAHIEDLEHLSPFGLAFGLNHAKQGRNGQELVFDDVHVFSKVQDFGLAAPAAMHHAVNAAAAFFEHFFD